MERNSALSQVLVPLNSNRCTHSVTAAIATTRARVAAQRSARDPEVRYGGPAPVSTGVFTDSQWGNTPQPEGHTRPRSRHGGHRPPPLRAAPGAKNTGLNGLNGFEPKHNPLNPFNPLFSPFFTEPGRR